MAKLLNDPNYASERGRLHRSLRHLTKPSRAASASWPEGDVARSESQYKLPSTRAGGAP